MNISKTRIRIWFTVCLVSACGCSTDSEVANRSPSGTNRDATADTHAAIESDYPVAVDGAKVGTYPRLTKSGGGYFYDDVLEYRVWIDSPGGDFYHAFSSFEDAQRFSDATPDAEEPLVLVFQQEHINEPETGSFEHVKTDRLTEWRVEWLKGSKRTPSSIPEFLLENGG